jgi:D-sedoheptulose 7-phosphate isomerase
MNIDNLIKKSLDVSLDTISKTIRSDSFSKNLSKASNCLIDTYNRKGKVMLAGNGGSAADAQHICAELVGRLNFDRAPLAAVALTTNTSNLTCIGNDYGYDEIFSRQLNAIAKSDDSLIVYTTSGNSKNIISLLKEAKYKVRHIIALTGNNTENIINYCDVIISVDSVSTTKIQELHAIAGHILCECVEKNIFEANE